MEEVNPEYTSISFQEGERVAAQLRARLPSIYGIVSKFQGSVPLNVHIEGVSDVDLLVLRTDFCTVDPLGPKANTYGDWSGCTAVDGLKALRANSKAALEDAYPAVTVDASGAKSISLTGGSLARKVDVVPSHWHETAPYQAYRQEKDRGVTILDSYAGVTLRNLPFLHIHEIHAKDVATGGGTKRVIRLLKSVRNDSDDAERIKLSSYEIAGLVWHFESATLIVHPWEELKLLAATQKQLAYLRENKSHAMSLLAPDGTRVLLDSTEKFIGLALLSLEVDRLSEAVARELDPYVSIYPNLVPNTLMNAKVY